MCLGVRTKAESVSLPSTVEGPGGFPGSGPDILGKTGSGR